MLLSLLSVRPALRPAVRPPAAGRPHGASMSALALDLDERYAAIAEALPRQRAAYTEWVASDAVDGPSLTAAASAVGIHLDVAGGQISYAPDFEQKRVPLAFDLIYCRHGKTTGNTEPRVYQGFVDEAQNALNEIGLQQAEDAADAMDALDLSPSLVVLSPLSRAAETGRAYTRRHPELAAVTEEWEETAEMRFGAWDNVMVKDLDDDNICHLFYLEQNSVVRPAEPYVNPADGVSYAGENFVQVLTRMQAQLIRLNEKVATLPPPADGARPLVVMYGHSMCGAALAILTGNGKQVDGENYLGFDGKYIMPNATPVYLHKSTSSGAASPVTGAQGGGEGLSYLSELAQLRSENMLLLAENKKLLAAGDVQLRAENALLLAENKKLRVAADDALAEILQGDALANIARQALLRNIAAINLFILVTFGLGVAYSLLETDLRAIFALYYFDLGPDVYPGFARAGVAIDLLLRLPGTLLHNYEALVPTNPVFYKACTSGVAYTFGDFISQVYQGRDLKSLDLPRSVRSGLAGFIGHGPLCHYWMLTMERYLDYGGAWWATGIKVLADQTVWALYLNAVYSFLIGTLAFRDPKEVWKDVKATSWPALRVSWRFWPFVHCISFSHAVPLDLKLLWVDVMEIVWVTLLSQIANQDGKEEMTREQSATVPTFGVDPALDIDLTSQVLRGELIFASASSGLWKEPTSSDPTDAWTLEGATFQTSDGTIVQEVAPQESGLPTTPVEALRAGWPLLALWPVLFLFYQVELALGLEV